MISATSRSAATAAWTLAESVRGSRTASAKSAASSCNNTYCRPGSKVSIAAHTICKHGSPNRPLLCRKPTYAAWVHPGRGRAVTALLRLGQKSVRFAGPFQLLTSIPVGTPDIPVRYVGFPQTPYDSPCKTGELLYSFIRPICAVLSSLWSRARR